jgi:hypothetical protein
MMGVVKQFKEHYKRAKAEGQGVGKSFARLIKAARDIPGMLQERPKGQKKYRPRTPYTTLKNQHRVPVAQGIAGAFVRMLDKRPYQFFTDGSLRHVLPGERLGKALGKALKRQRQRQRTESARRASLQSTAA